MSTSLKLVLNDEVRRISLAKIDYDTVVSQAKTLFNLGDGNISLAWCDEEGDMVTISTAKEMEEAVHALKAEGKTLRFTVKATKAESDTRTDDKNPAVHRHVECDVCGVSPIVGSRFKCTERPNYDLCEKCEAKDQTGFTMIKFTSPRDESQHLPPPPGGGGF